jgi:hypothetical protein
MNRFSIWRKLWEDAAAVAEEAAALVLPQENIFTELP